VTLFVADPADRVMFMPDRFDALLGDPDEQPFSARLRQLFGPELRIGPAGYYYSAPIAAVATRIESLIELLTEVQTKVTSLSQEPPALGSVDPADGRPLDI
jgi:hypothetical protein